MKQYKYKIITVLQSIHSTIPTTASKMFKHNDIVSYNDVYSFATNHGFAFEMFQGGVLRVYDMKGVIHLEATLMDSELEKGFIN